MIVASFAALVALFCIAQASTVKNKAVSVTDRKLARFFHAIVASSRDIRESMASRFDQEMFVSPFWHAMKDHLDHNVPLRHRKQEEIVLAALQDGKSVVNWQAVLDACRVASADDLTKALDKLHHWLKPNIDFVFIIPENGFRLPIQALDGFRSAFSMHSVIYRQYDEMKIAFCPDYIPVNAHVAFALYTRRSYAASGFIKPPGSGLKEQADLSEHLTYEGPQISLLDLDSSGSLDDHPHRSGSGDIDYFPY